MTTWDNSFSRLPEHMFTALPPAPVAWPEIQMWNNGLATDLDLPKDADIWAGNRIPDGASPLAQLYAGHQFGNWNPQLGDGRAILLGEVLDAQGARFDVQLKGSGPTPYSRAGDGRNWVGPALREYLVSEAMHALGVPTTRALAVTTTGETVLREAPLPGAVVTRIASSHIRVGTFQIYAARQDVPALEALTAHTIARHYPDADGPAGLLAAATQAQAKLVARWMGVGFIHGVMNTDNAHVGGITIDYGPCAFMDDYHPHRVFSSIDHGGRYAYANQPNIAAWNMAQFATALLPLMPDRDAAISEFTEIVNSFADHYQSAWTETFGAKLGLSSLDDDGVALVGDLLKMMTEAEADFTNTFRGLAHELPVEHPDFAAWHTRWQAHTPDLSLMAASNPQVIPRNHLIEAAIQAAVADDWLPAKDLHAVLSTPFVDPGDHRYTTPPTEAEVVHQTFCGT